MLLLESCYRRCFRGGRDLLSWDVPLKPHASGDYSLAVVQANSSLEDQAQVFSSPSSTFVGVYDGHGGPDASRFISASLFPYIRKFASEQGGMSAEVMRRAFRATEEDFLRLVKRSLLTRPQIVSSGSCCLVGAISDNVLYVANLGDSRAVLGRRATDGRLACNSSTAVAERLSTDHNVGVEEVRKEVQALHPDDSQILIFTRGVWRIKGIIQVSRSIGDIYLKKPEFSRDPRFHMHGSPVPLKKAVISAEPSIVIRKLQPGDLFLIFASDGLWEQLNDEAAVEIVLKYPRPGIARRLVRAALEEVAKKKETRYEDLRRLERGVRRCFHDDITVVVIFLDQHDTFGSKFKDGKVADCTTVPADIFSFNSNAEDNMAINFH